ncbi:MAG: pyridoxamine 5'-phosphate oxidase family protein, partial [Candidatus Omnitrophica bacterium]|nr:pyridoxamine 5'-phosphate oxidase family protein [Candidatus Omnitrophota bacterium]
DGTVYLLDLYKGRTSKNLKQNPNASITAVDEHKFRGWCLKGTARIINGDELPSGVLAEWKKKITGRITHRLIKNMHGEKGHPLHPEAQLPKPEYLIEMVVKEIVNLTPSTLKK